MLTYHSLQRLSPRHALVHLSPHFRLHCRYNDNLSSIPHQIEIWWRCGESNLQDIYPRRSVRPSFLFDRVRFSQSLPGIFYFILISLANIINGIFNALPDPAVGALAVPLSLVFPVVLASRMSVLFHTAQFFSRTHSLVAGFLIYANKALHCRIHLTTPRVLA